MSLILAGLVACLLSAAQDPVGTVLEVKGKWILDDTPVIALERGSPLPGGGRIRPPQPPMPGDHLLVVFVFDGDHTRTLRLSCDKRECERVVDLPTLPASYRLAAQVRRVRDALSLLLTDNSFFALRRARDDDSLRDAVVRVADGVVDLTPAIVQLPNQRYVARFTPITKAGDSAKPIESTVFTSARAQAVRGDGLRPGAYKLELMVDGEYTRSGPEVWILAVNAGSFPAAAEAFTQAGKASESLQDAGAATRHAFLRAFLLNLAADNSIGR
jgi:hypothetical protein